MLDQRRRNLVTTNPDRKYFAGRTSHSDSEEGYPDHPAQVVDNDMIRQLPRHVNPKTGLLQQHHLPSPLSCARISQADS